LLTPLADGFSYTQETIISTGGTIGAMAVDDIDGDGLAEFFFGDYDNGVVYAYRFSESASL